MSSIIMHIYISQKVQKELNLSNKFVAGAILPDMIKIMTKSKDITHYIKEYERGNKIIKLPDLESFLQDNKDKLNDEVTLGYYAHLIEDRIWFDTYVDSFAKCIDKEKILYTFDNTIHKSEEFKKDMYSDYINVDSYIIEKDNLDIDKIRLSIKDDLRGYNVDKIIDENVVFPIKNENTKINFISHECLNNYIDESIKKVKEEISRIVGE
ncbi:MAG: zinc dependent phospholipase C family protein [Clostridia bacterium]|nr:zinc dependent phospholipase C family protein [Clostridia bacterium]MDD4386206.1 zinc dependent phospholipase C family protein [Clostridia bacterium]